MADESQTVTVNVKGPSEIKLSVQVTLDTTVRGLKEKIAEQRSDIPADSQRLIYTGKVLKDEETLASYKLQNNHTIHMVRSAARSAPVSGNPSTSAASANNNNTSSASTTASGTQGSAAQGVPSSFGAGQAFGSDPLAALNRADFAGPQMTALSRDLFQGFGMNPNDPNMLMTAMQSEDFRTQMRSMLQRPEVIDQIIASNPQLSQMPGVRELFQSEQFREFLLDPQSMARAAELSRQMGGLGGMGEMGGMGGMGGFGGFGGAPGAGQGQGQGQGAGAQWPPPGAFGQQGSANAAGQQQQQQQQPGSGGGAAAAANPFAALLGQQGGAGGPPGGMFDPAFMRQLYASGRAGAGANPFAAFGRGGAAGGAPADSRPAEERYADQLAQMQSMGLTDGSANLRALLMAGGSVEGAMSILFDDPAAGGGANPRP